MSSAGEEERSKSKILGTSYRGSDALTDNRRVPAINRVTPTPGGPPARRLSRLRWRRQRQTLVGALNSQHIIYCGKTDGRLLRRVDLARGAKSTGRSEARRARCR